MSELKHTPGPWVTETNGWGETSVKSANHSDLAEWPVEYFIAEKVGGHVRGEDFTDFSEVHANAKLIAAAPALYAALERISRPHECGCVPCTGSCTSEMALQITVEEMRQLARDAIQKATA